MNISTLNLSGIKARLAMTLDDLEPPEPEACWRCAVCGDVHEEKGDAERCCEKKHKVPDEDRESCPVCGSECGDAYSAADCCLWKDLPLEDRNRAAKAVEAGAKWSEALGIA